MRISRKITASLAACALCLLVSAALTGVGVASAHSVKLVPKTVFQCQKQFKGAKRAACIKRVKAEKPGTSCAHPLKSYYLRDKEKAGDTKDMPIISGPGSPPADFFIGHHVQPPEVTDYEVVHVTSNSRVVICHIELVIYEDPNGTTVRHYQLPTGPHGSKPITIGETEGSFEIVVEGRYASGHA